MEKRIGTITILVLDRSRSAEIAVISLIVEGTPDRINSLTGRLGRLQGVESKAVLTKNS